MRDGFIWDKVFNGPSEICRRQPLKILKWYGLPKHISFIISQYTLTHFMPPVSFYTPWKFQKTRVFYVCKGYEMGYI